MTQTKTRQLTLLAILTALTVVLGLFVKIPTVKGVTTLLDAGIFFTAFYLGKKEGAIVGGISAFLFDLIAGYPQWMFISLFAHAGQGYLAGFTGKKRYLGVLLASGFMIVTYFIASSWMYDIVAATGDILTNILQNVVGMLVGFTLVKAIEQVKSR